LTTEWSGWAKDVTFRGNTFASQGTAVYGHAASANKDGTYELGRGWGGSRGGSIVFEGNRFLGNHVDPPEAVAPGDASGQEIAAMMQSEPQFDPATPAGFDDYLTKHRAWMIALFTKQFGHPPVLEAPAPIPVTSTANPK
jgi:hypothetical protein